MKSSAEGMIHCVGSDHPNGTYCLRISLKKSVNLAFGRFKKGKVIRLQAGEYLYIGSALAKRGSTTIGNRLRRHTSRSVDQSPHKIQKPILAFFNEIGISYTSKPSPKRMHWNIDHLLNLLSAEIIGIIFIRNPKPLENSWSAYLEQLPETKIIEKGLGANDSAGHTHIQRSNLSPDQWDKLPYKLPI